MKRVFFLAIGVLVSLTFSQLYAQDGSEEKVYKRKKFDFSFDSDRTFLTEKSVRFFGFKVGLQYDDKFRVGLGIQILNDSVPVNVLVNEGLPTAYNTNGTLDVTLLTLYYERILYHSKRWEFSAPLHFGIGGITKSYLDTFGRDAEKNIGGFTTISLAGEGHYKVFSWIGIGAGVGYRWAIFKDKEIQSLVNAPFYVLKVKLFVGVLYKAIFKKEKAWEQYRQEEADN